MVRQTAPARYEIAEFYVIPEFRGTDVAVDFAVELTKVFCGEFFFSTRTENQRAVKFWDKFASRYIHNASVADGYKQWRIKANNSAE